MMNSFRTFQFWAWHFDATPAPDFGVSNAETDGTPFLREWQDQQEALLHTLGRMWRTFPAFTHRARYRGLIRYAAKVLRRPTML